MVRLKPSTIFLVTRSVQIGPEAHRLPNFGNWGCLLRRQRQYDANHTTQFHLVPRLGRSIDVSLTASTGKNTALGKKFTYYYYYYYHNYWMEFSKLWESSVAGTGNIQERKIQFYSNFISTHTLAVFSPKS